MKQPFKIDWLKLEQEMREVLGDLDFSEKDALDCISAILGWHTGRGYERTLDNESNKLSYLKKRFPKYFERVD